VTAKRRTRRFALPLFIPRPTRRGWAILGLAVVLYLFANQTQVSWLYVFAALGVGVWLATAGLPRRMLAALTATRRLDEAGGGADRERHVGDPLAVTLTLHNAGNLPAAQLRGEEVCPAAPPAEQAQPFFLSVPARGQAELRYTTVCARRGWFEFPPLPVSTRAPFGFFAARRQLSAPAGVLVFPAYRELPRFPLLDRRPSVQNPLATVGLGSEFVGVREYRPGDSPRHVHWRSTARAGRLIVKEFAEETQPGLTIALDVRAASALGPTGADSLELAIQVAATLVHYAERRALAVTLVSNSRAWPAPPGPLGRWAAMNYLARLPADGERPLADVLQRAAPAVFVAALLPSPDEAAGAALIELKQQGPEVLAVLIDPAPFAPDLVGQAAALAGALRASGVAVRVLGGLPDWERDLVSDDRAAARW